MIRAQLHRFRSASRAVGPCLALLAAAGSLAPSSGTQFSDSFETWTGPWTTRASTGNQVIAMVPAQDTMGTNGLGAWDGSKALRVQYGGVPTSATAEAIAGYASGLLYGAAVRLMLYVPQVTLGALPPGARIRIVRLAPSISDTSANVGLYLRKGAAATDGLYLEGEYTAPVVGPKQIGGLTETGIAPGTWHTVELDYDPGAVVGASVSLYIDDPVRPRASRNEGALTDFGLAAVAVGLAGSVQTASTTPPLVWWIDDVTLTDQLIGQGPPRVHLHQDGFEAPNVDLLADPPGKSRVRAVGGSVAKVQGHRGGGAECVDQSFDSSGTSSAIFGQLNGVNTGSLGKLYHRVWWQSGGTASAAGQHPLVAITSANFGGAGPLDEPMAAISAAADGSLVLWGFSYVNVAKVRDQDVSMGQPLSPGWHLLELEVVGSGTLVGQRAAFVDGQMTGVQNLNWSNTFPTQWVDGHIQDDLNTTFQGRDQYDDSRTSLAPQPSHFGFQAGTSAAVGQCATFVVQAQDSFANSPQPVPEDTVVAFYTSGAGTFYRTASCAAGTELSQLFMPAGAAAFSAYFKPSGTTLGDAIISLAGIDYLSRDSLVTINGTVPVDSTPPSVPGQVDPSATLVRAPVDVSWSGSRDEDGGSGLQGYDVEASRNDGGWAFYANQSASTPGGVAGITFDNGEGLWRLRARARDYAGNVSDAGLESVPVLVDQTAPIPPDVYSASLTGPGAAAVIWLPATDLGQPPSGIGSYSVNVLERQTNMQRTVPAGTATSVNVSVRPGYTYDFRVFAQDNAGNISGLGGAGTVQVPGIASRLRLLGFARVGATGVAVMNQPNDVTVAAVDDGGRLASSYTHQVSFVAQPAGTTDVPPPYQFSTTDQGIRSFFQGVVFHSTGTFRVTVTDAQSPALTDSVYVTVIAPSTVQVIRDANLLASPGIPYVYNAAGAVRAVSSVPVTFARCGGPSEFLVDPDSGAVRWVPKDDESWPVDVCVRAATSAGAHDDYSFQVQRAMPGATPPVAAFLVSPSLAGPGTFASFDPTGSTASPGPPLYRWRFGDGSPLSFEDQPFHKYWLPGGYRPALTVFDLAGRSDHATQSVGIKDRYGNDPPDVKIQTPPQLAEDRLNAPLAAGAQQGSAAPGEIHWDLGNGVFATGASVTGTYEQGTRTWATATVVDAHGLPASDKVEIGVKKSGKVPPFCAATANPPVVLLPDTVAQPGVTWTAFRSPGSAELRSVTWTIDGQTYAVAEKEINYSAATAGWHRGSLTVVDKDDLVCTDSVMVLVLQPGAGAAPPRVVDPGLQGTAVCNTTYAGRPALAAGESAVTWQLVPGKSPPGMTIDPATGAVTWPADLRSATEVTYVLQATDSSGASDTLAVSVPYQCGGVTFDTCGGCGAGAGGGAPAVAALLGLVLWAMARRRTPLGRRASLSASRTRGTLEDRPGGRVVRLSASRPPGAPPR